MIPPSTDALIVDFVQTMGMMRAGEAYARQERVGEFDIDTDLMGSVASRSVRRNSLFVIVVYAARLLN